MPKKEKPIRQKSEETLLKEQKRQLDRDLIKINKKITEFNNLEAEIAAVRADREDLTEQLGIVKTRLITVMGLD